MAGIRTILVATAAALALGAGVAVADQPPWAHGNKHMEGRAPARAAISGTVIGVDYASASILVGTPRGVVPVAITPSTGIYRGNSFASFADLGRGAHVDIEAAVINGRLIAQFIRIR